MYWNIEYKPYTETITFYKAMYKIWYADSVFFPSRTLCAHPVPFSHFTYW